MFQETFVLTIFKGRRNIFVVCKEEILRFARVVSFTTTWLLFPVFCNHLCLSNILFSFPSLLAPLPTYTAHPITPHQDITVDISCNFYARKMCVWQPVCVLRGQLLGETRIAAALEGKEASLCPMNHKPQTSCCTRASASYVSPGQKTREGRRFVCSTDCSTLLRLLHVLMRLLECAKTDRL